MIRRPCYEQQTVAPLRASLPARRSITWIAALSSVVLLGLIFWPRPGLAEIDGDLYSSPTWGITARAPHGWQLTDKTSYPNILVVMSRTDPDAKILLSAQHVPAGETTREYAEKTAVLLHDMGFHLGLPRRHAATGARWFDLETKDAFLRQAYWVSGDIGFALTLTTPSPVIRNQQLRAFDAVLRTVSITTPVAPPPQDAGPAEPASPPAPPPG